jgi:hypothetical protein
MKRFAFLILALFAMGVFLSFNDKILPQQEVENKETITPIAAAGQIPSGWIAFSSEELGVEFGVPPRFKIEKNGSNSVLANPPAGQDPAGNTRFFYVSVIPAALKNDDTAQVYNYSSSFNKKLLSIKVGEVKSLSDNAGLMAWYNYERQPDEVFNGYAAKVFVNLKPWEFPAGTVEYRYIFEFAEKTVITGAYIDGGPTDAPLNLPVLSQIMKTFKVIE